MKKVTIALGVLIMLSSCSSTYNHRYVDLNPIRKINNRARRALEKKIESKQRQFVVVNNQIIIFENIY
jgi:hypothetical protein